MNAAMIKINNWCYADTNAIINLWDIFVKAEKEGDSRLNISKTIFHNIVISEYVIDELLNFSPKNDKGVNGLKKNICLLTILQKLPVVRSYPNISNQEEINISNCLVPSNEIQGYVSALILHLSGIKKNTMIEKIMKDKKTMTMVSEWFIKPRGSNKANYCEPSERIAIDSFIAEMLEKYDVNNPQQYQSFCMEIYAAVRDRRIKLPDGLDKKRFYKDPKYSLNQQFDLYHMCYAKHVKIFVTDDQVLYWLATKFKKHSIIDSEIMTSNDFYKFQIRNLIMNGNTK